MIKPMVRGNYDLVKKINTSLVLQTIRDRGPLSRADIAGVTKLNPVTVSSIVGELLSARLVREKGPGVSSGGRRPILVELNPTDRFVVGVAISISSFSVVVSNLIGEILERADIVADFQDPASVLDKVVHTVRDAIQKLSLPCTQILGLGIGVPGILDKDRGHLLFSPNMPSWRDVPLRQFLREELPFPVFIENDASAAALGEQWFGAGRGVDNFIFVFADMGIGGGLILNRQMYGGRDNGAGEIGHIVVEVNGPKCNCGSYGCLETMASGLVLIRKARKLIASGTASKMRDMVGGDPDKVTLDVLKEAARQGDELAGRMMLESAEYIGVAVGSAINLFNPEMIVLGGQLVEDNPTLIAHVEETAAKRAYGLLAKDVRVVCSKLGRDVCTLGAVTLVLRGVFSDYTSLSVYLKQEGSQ